MSSIPLFDADCVKWDRRAVDRAIPPLIKWTGSKRSQARKIAELMPTYRHYLEPFVGGGAMLYVVAASGSVASDVYKPLIELWRLLQNHPTAVIDNYTAQWRLLVAELTALDIRNLPPDVLLPAYFYKVRDRYNETKDPLDLNFILRTCVNGIVRFNHRGEFNNSFHLSRRGMEPARFAKIVRAWRVAIEGVHFLCQDYEETLACANKGDFVYLDPPYAGNKQRYAKDLDLDRFFRALDGLNQRGASWALSFDGRRGDESFVHDVPKDLYKRHIFLSSGTSAVNRVLNGPVERVEESLYLNY